MHLQLPLFRFLTPFCLLSVGLSPAVLFPCVQHEPGDASETVTQCQYLDGCHPRHQTPVNATKGPRISILTNTHHNAIHSTHAVAIITDQREDKYYINNKIYLIHSVTSYSVACYYCTVVLTCGFIEKSQILLSVLLMYILIS